MYFGIRQGWERYLILTLILAPVFVNNPIGSSSKILYSGVLKRGRIKKSNFLVCKVSNLNFLPLESFIRCFDSNEMESVPSGSMILTFTPDGGPVTFIISGSFKLYNLISLVSL